VIMRIIGYGFLARNLAGIASRHPGAVVLAAGVSWASGTSTDQFDRESTLVRETAARCRADGTRLLFFSTASTGMYGLGKEGREDEPVRPSTPYGRHKYGLELALRDSGVDFLALRLSHLVGPHQPAHQLLPALISQIRSGTVQVHRGAYRDLIDVADVVRIVDGLLSHGVSRDVVNVASGRPVAVTDIVDQVERRLGVTAVRHYVDAPANHLVSTAKLRRLLPAIGPDDFPPDYHRPVLDRCLRSAAPSGPVPIFF
jgi:nucleoside-diphosphate-sugar epimerase